LNALNLFGANQGVVFNNMDPILEMVILVEFAGIIEIKIKTFDS
jgi:hypothetical protein